MSWSYKIEDRGSEGAIIVLIKGNVARGGVQVKNKDELNAWMAGLDLIILKDKSEST